MCTYYLIYVEETVQVILGDVDSFNQDLCWNEVTGGNGFLGQEIIKLLIEENLSEIRILDKVIEQAFVEDLQALTGGRIKVTAFIGDVRDKEVLQTACEGVTCVIHTASVIDVWGYISNEELEAVNVKGTQLLIETSIQQNVKCFIYTSSVEVVGPNVRGDSICNGDEDTVYPSKLKFYYSKTKQVAEQLVLTSNGCLLPNGEQMVTCAVRPTYIYGENCRFMIPHLDEGINNGNILKRTSRKQALVNPVYVRNVAWAHILVARAMKDKDRKKIVGGKFYYITDDTPHMSYSDFNHEMMSPLGFTLPEKLSMPLLLMYFTSFMMEMLQFLLQPFITYVPRINRHLITMFNTKFTFTSHKAFSDFDYIPRYSWEVAKKRTTAWLASIVQDRRDNLNKKKLELQKQKPKS